MDEPFESPLFGDMSVGAIRPVNVASVPQRSPFRYPGGKTWFVPTLRLWFRTMDRRPSVLVEPFLGGGIISLTALFEDFVDRAVMVELDDDVSSVWQAVADGDGAWLADRILHFNLNEQSLMQELTAPTQSNRERAFKTLLKNRTYHGGILAEGSGLLRHGENGRGIRSRWYPGTLARRFLDLGVIAHRMDFRHEDGLLVIEQYAARRDAVFFIDPPYTAGGKFAGRRLYRHSSLDHAQLFELCASLAGDFLMTYDHTDEVIDLARAHGFSMRLIPMKNTHHSRMEELIIGRDLSWLDALPAVHEPAREYFGNSQDKGQGSESALLA